MSELRRYGKQLRGRGKIRKAKAVEVRDLQQYGAIEMDGLLLCKKKDSAPIYSHRSRRSIFFIKMRGVLPILITMAFLLRMQCFFGE